MIIYVTNSPVDISPIQVLISDAAMDNPIVTHIEIMA